MSTSSPAPVSRWSRLPSIVWIILLLGGIAALIGGIILLFYLLSHVEGAASILMLLAAWGVIRVASVPQPEEPIPNSYAGLITGLGIAFFALMGMAIDQPGNVIYNQPLEWLFCPSGTELKRNVVVTHPLPERTDVTQDFACYAQEARTSTRTISQFEVMGVRLAEYILIGYALILLNQVYMRLRFRSP